MAPRFVNTSSRRAGSTATARLHRVADFGAGGTGTALARVAHEAGYVDQSHFIRDVRAVTGEPTGWFFYAAAYC